MLSSLSRDNKLVFFALALWGVGEGLWWYLLPLYVESLGANPVQIGLVLSLGMVLVTISLIPSGWMTDRVSRRSMMIIGWVMGLVAILVLAAAQTWQQAIPGLVLYNLCAFNMPAINSYVTAEVKKGQDVRKVFTTVFSGFTLGMLISPAAGGWLADVLGLRPLFLLAAVAFGISALLIFMIKEQPVQQAHTEGTVRPLLNNRPFIYLSVLFFFAFLFAHLGIPLSSNFMRDIRGYDMAVIGILGSINSLGSLVLTIWLGRWPRSRTASLILAEMTVASYPLIMLTTTSFPWMAVALFMRGGVGTMRQLAGARLGELMPSRSMGLGFGVFSTVVNLAFTISPYIAGWLYAANPMYPFVASLAGLIPVMFMTGYVGRVISRLQAGVGATAGIEASPAP